MTKTYALFDVVGVKEAVREGKGGQVLTAFWTAADAWTNGRANSLGQRPVLGGRHLEAPRVAVVTFSDSALMFTRPEFELEVFYEVAQSLKTVLEAAVGRVYCIVSRGDEIDHPSLPALGMKVVDETLAPAYFSVAGSGSAWVNLHLADRAIGARKDWHDRFSMYCVGASSLPRTGHPQAEQVFKDLDGNDTLVFALA